LPEQAQEEERIKAMTDLVDGAIRTVRRVATELRPGMLDDLGLPAALEWQAQEFSRYTGIHTNLEIGRGSFILSREVSTAFFRIFQESLTNIARHAQASQVEIKLKKSAGKVFLIIQDNGRGIYPEEVTNPRSFGILGMRERARAVNGEFAVQNAPRKGTIVSVSVQVNKKPQPTGQP
jgi:signal transduction histidine kinase